jgi:phosphotransferase system  glucose/maltose/N-acetylglucosamine-specific IIC component
MALIGRLFVILFGFLAACLVAGMIVVGAVLFPEFSDFETSPIDQEGLNIVLGFGFIFVSGFALLPAMIVAAITEAFSIRGALSYAVGGAIIGLACYLGLVPFDTETLRFDGIVRRHLEIMTGAGIVGGVVYWMIAGRNAGAWREPPRTPRFPPPTPAHSPRPQELPPSS